MNPKQVHATNSEAETIDLGANFAHSLVGGERIALLGDFGAGKTRFVRGMAIGLGHDPARVSSPTYVIAHEYVTPGAALTLVHVDAYRMTRDDDPDQLGLDQLGAETVLVAEWATRCAGVLPETTHEIELEHTGESARRITIRTVQSPR
jgi:tRNA threonylcarbamoyladenosine biosynthesis protein TsaE